MYVIVCFHKVEAPISVKFGFIFNPSFKVSFRISVVSIMYSRDTNWLTAYLHPNIKSSFNGNLLFPRSFYFIATAQNI